MMICDLMTTSWECDSWDSTLLDFPEEELLQLEETLEELKADDLPIGDEIEEKEHACSCSSGCGSNYSRGDCNCSSSCGSSYARNGSCNCSSNCGSNYSQA